MKSTCGCEVNGDVWTKCGSHVGTTDPVFSLHQILYVHGFFPSYEKAGAEARRIVAMEQKAL